MKKKPIIENILDAVTVLTIIATFLFAVVGIAFNLVYIRTPVKGYSMSPTLNVSVTDENQDGDVVFINKYSSFKNNDIVVANVEWWNKGPIIKRLVASPGDLIQIKEETETFDMFVNGNLIYSKEKTTISSHGTPGGTQSYYNTYVNFLSNPQFSQNIVEINGETYIAMLENQYFLVGDNWAESTDCMEFGPVTSENIVGKVDIIVKLGDSPIWAMVKEMIKIAFKPNWI